MVPRASTFSHGCLLFTRAVRAGFSDYKLLIHAATDNPFLLFTTRLRGLFAPGAREDCCREGRKREREKEREKTDTNFLSRKSRILFAIGEASVKQGRSIQKE